MLANFTRDQIDELASILNTFGSEEIQRQYKSTIPYIENQYFKVTSEESVDGDSAVEYKAVEVCPNGDEAHNGIVFDSDKTPTDDISQPIYLPNLKINAELFSGSVEIGKAYQVEEVDSGTFGEASEWYIIPKGGASLSDYRIRVKGDSSLIYGSGRDEIGEVLDDNDNVIVDDITLFQNKFSSCRIFSGEILVAQKKSGDNGDYYDVTANLSGVGVPSWDE